MEDVAFNKFITKGINIEKDDGSARVFTGHITVEIIDKQNEFVAVDELLKSMDTWLKCGAPISDSHSNRFVGKGLEYEKSEYDGHPSIKIKAEIYNSYELHNKVWKKILSKEYGGLSIGGGSKSGRTIIEKHGKMGYALKDLELYEVAVCKSPANSLAIIDNVNEIAKSYELVTKNAGDRSFIQCDSIDCIIEKDEPEEVILAKAILEKHTGLGARVVSNEQLDNQDPPENSTVKKPEEKESVKYIKNNTVKYDMSSEETKKEEEKKPEAKEIKPEEEEKKDMHKDYDSVIKLLTQNIIKQDDKIDTILKSIEELKKDNPVNNGEKLETAPNKAGEESGIKVKAPDTYQSNSEQSGINQDDKTPAVPEKKGLQMQEKADDKPEEEKPEEKKNEDLVETKKEDVLKTSDGVYEYTKTETPRPANASGIPDLNGSPDGYQILKATRDDGWGKTNDSVESLREMYVKYNNGEFTGGVIPTGGLA